MKKIQIPLVLLGILNLLIPLGLTARFILAYKYHQGSPPGLWPSIHGLVPLISGAIFIYLGTSLTKIMYGHPSMPIMTLRVWIAVVFITAAISAFLGSRPGLIGVVCVAMIYWYFSWALKKETGDVA
jgi:hypothetical protein